MVIQLFKKASVVLTLAFFVTGCSSKPEETETATETPNTVEQLESSMVAEETELDTEETSQDLVKTLLGDESPKGQMDERNGIEKSLLLENKPVDSHYKTILSQENQEIYDGLTSAIYNMSVDYIIDKPVDPESVRQMMRIILLDEPEFWYLKDYYTYQLDEYSNVVKITFNYQMSPDDRNRIENDYISINRRIYSDLGDAVTQFEQFETVLSRVMRRKLQPYVEMEGFEGNFGNTILSIVSAEYEVQEVSPQGLAKALNFYLRRSGIPSISVYGNYITNDFKQAGLEYPTEDFVENVTVDGSTHSVKLNSDNVYVWNLVQLNGSWYHVDLYYNTKIQEVINSALTSIGESLNSSSSSNAFELGLNMSDKTAALGRLFYVNEEILGIQPMSRNNNFNYVVQKGLPFVKTSSSNELRAKIFQELNKNTFRNKPNKFTLTFEDADNYQQANEEIEAIIEDIESGIGLSIKEYKSLQLTGSATILFYGIVYE